LSGALTAELLAHRTAGLRAQVIERPGLALRLMVQSLLLDGSYRRPVAKISGHGPYLKATCPTINETKAGRMLADKMDRLGHHHPGRPVDVLPWLLSLTDPEVIGMLAPLVASTVDAGTEDWSQRGQSSLAAQTARAADPEYVRLLDTRHRELFRTHHQGADRASGARSRGSNAAVRCGWQESGHCCRRNATGRGHRLAAEHPTGATGRQRGVSRHAGRADLPASGRFPGHGRSGSSRPNRQ
jgi:hypothetical protein